ncbi:Uu.00g144390.m01.CDS01 [Anthostomella pinea]|uniref:Uu.00g144390.m01.CDS01 n=1 Tax=Anthostomella pinea TaxID=933095 RepID=A0AAI8VQV2_9PEZI|nr:Uu.00g144390.m01.CDS01 [Anthostomella pinea]
MSSTIAIPASRSSATTYEDSPKTATSSSSSYSSSPQTPGLSKSSPSQSSHKPKTVHERRPSMLSSAFSKDECTVINIGDPDGPPRLISYLASSQGFVWNPEIFLPSYVDCDYVPLENRREPVHEIRLSDEELKRMLP